VAVILLERIGTWSGQLRARLSDRPVRWFETRSLADLDATLIGIASPVVLIDLRRNVEEGLKGLDRVMMLAPGARVLVLDPESHDGLADLAREMGAACVISGFVPPPEIASLIDRWINLAVAAMDKAGWSRPLAPGSSLAIAVEGWLEAIGGGVPERPSRSKPV
jgi:hypothetical protein